MVRLNLKDSIQCIIKYQHQPISIPTITNRIDRRMEARMSPRKPSIAKHLLTLLKIRKRENLIDQQKMENIKDDYNRLRETGIIVFITF